MSGVLPGDNTLISAGYILPSAPFVNPKTGTITPVWWRFLMSLLARTGGVPGVDVIDVQLLAAIGGIDPDDPVDLADLLARLNECDGDLAQQIADEVRLSIAFAAIQPEQVADDAWPTLLPEDERRDDLASLLLGSEHELAAFVESWTWALPETTIVTADTYTICGAAPCNGAIISMQAVNGTVALSGVTETVTINGSPVTGINAVNVNSSTPLTFTATGANNFKMGDTIKIVVAIGSGVPVGAWSSVLYVRTLQ